MTAYLDSSVTLRYILAGEAGNTENVHVFSHDSALNTCARTLGMGVRLG